MMTGFAEGFASGYGLMDATLKNKRDEELKQKALDAENAKTASTADSENKKLGLETIKANDARQHNTDIINYYNENNKNDKARIDAQATYQKGELDIRGKANNIAAQQAAMQSQLAKSTIDQNIIENQQKKLKLDQEKRIEEMSNAQRALVAYKSPTGINVPTDPAQFDEFSKLIKQGTGQSIDTIWRNKGVYAGAAQHLQKTFAEHNGSPINESNEPNAIKALNVAFKPMADVNIGEKNIKTGDVVLSKQFSDILPHDVPATADNPSGKVYTLGMQTTYKRPDGSTYTDKSSPMTELRSVNNDIDPNIKTFTQQQLFGLINGKTAMIDEIATNPIIQQHLSKTIADNTPKEDKGKEDKWLDVSEKGLDGESKAQVNARTNEVIKMKDGDVVKGRVGLSDDKPNGKLQIRYDKNGNAFTKDENGNVIPYTSK